MKKQDTSENLVKLVYLAIGSNLGNKIYNIQTAKLELEKYEVKILKSSSVYSTDSWPDPTKPGYFNIVIKIKTYLDPVELLKICNIIEIKLGRFRTEKNAPRTCDIDIIDYNKNLLNEKDKRLILPHPRMSKRNFVLLPLFEIEKNWFHPIKKVYIKTLIFSLSNDNIRSIKQI